MQLGNLTNFFVLQTFFDLRELQSVCKAPKSAEPDYSTGFSVINGVTDKTPSTTDFCTSPCPGLSSCSVQTADSFFSTLAKKSAHSAIRLAWRVTTTLKTTTTKTKNIKSRAHNQTSMRRKWCTAADGQLGRVLCHVSCSSHLPRIQTRRLRATLQPHQHNNTVYTFPIAVIGVCVCNCVWEWEMNVVTKCKTPAMRRLHCSTTLWPVNTVL